MNIFSFAAKTATLGNFFLTAYTGVPASLSKIQGMGLRKRLSLMFW